jgi:beta-galactosidase
MTPFPFPRRNAYNGLCLVIIRSKEGQHGIITVRVHADKLMDGRLTVQAQ